MRFTIAALAALSAAPAAADYSDHRGVRLFSDRPCTEALATIDQPLDRYTDRGLASLPDAAREAAAQAMAWGFVLGFDTAAGGLHGDGRTTLERLRLACAMNPDTPALDLLRGFQVPPVLAD